MSDHENFVVGPKDGIEHIPVPGSRPIVSYCGVSLVGGRTPRADWRSGYCPMCDDEETMRMLTEIDSRTRRMSP